MKHTTKILISIALLISLALPFLVPSGALLDERKAQMLDEFWFQEEEAIEGFWLRFLIASAKAEEKRFVTPLPIDFSPGYPLNPQGFSDTGYEDDSISLKLETIQRNGVVYRVAYVDIAHPSQLRTTTAGKLTSSRVALISSMADKNNAVIAINANYLTNDPVKTSFEYRMGQKVRNRPNRTKDLLIIDENADFHLFIKSPKDEIQVFLDSGKQIVNAFTFGPALVKDGVLLELDKEYGYNPHGDEPRMAIGQVGPLSYILVLAEGRTAKSSGVTHKELADFMFNMGCIQAFNLDGGNSATMVFNGGYYQDKTKNNERAQSDMIYFASGIAP